jgi:hypothetical protein
MRFFIALCVAMLVVIGCGVDASQISAYSFSGGYVMQEETVPDAPAGAQVGSIVVKDTRENGDVIGQRYSEEDTSLKYDITYLDDTTSWAAAGATRILGDAGVGLDSGASTLELTITRLHVEVSIFSQGEFDGAVTLTAVLRGANGSECWRGNTNGEASNWGDPSNPLNYQETMSHALDRAMISLLNNAAFTKALTECD